MIKLTHICLMDVSWDTPPAANTTAVCIHSIIDLIIQ